MNTSHCELYTVWVHILSIHLILQTWDLSYHLHRLQQLDTTDRSCPFRVVILVIYFQIMYVSR